MWRSLIFVCVFSTLGFIFLSWERGCYLKREAQKLPPNSDEEMVTANQASHAGRELFPPDKYLVHARAISVQRDEFVECTQLRIERVYIGEPSLKGRTFQSDRYYRAGIGQFTFSSINEYNPPIEIGEVGIWWVTRGGFKDYLSADFGLRLATVGGCKPARKGIASNSSGHCSPSYEDALEYAALWRRLYNASDTRSQMAILRQAVVSRNPIISDGAFNLLFARRPPGFLDCLKELAADPNTPARKLCVIKEFIDDVRKKKAREMEPEPF